MDLLDRRSDIQKSALQHATVFAIIRGSKKSETTPL